MAVGTGLLIGSVSFELIDEAIKTRTFEVAALVLLGAAAFTVGDWLLTRKGGGERKDSEGAQAEGHSRSSSARSSTVSPRRSCSA